MTFISRLVCILALGVAVQRSLGQNLNANSELSLGVAAYEKAEYHDAIEHLERVVTLSPKSVSGHFYLAKSYDNAYSEECDRNCDRNEQWRLRAIEEYDRVLELEPSNTEALKALGWRYYRMADFDKADHFYRKALEVNRNDFEALYTVAVIQWQHSYEIRIHKRGELKLESNKALINLPSCAEMRRVNLAHIEDAMSLLKRADELGQSYDVKAYISLLYRERADIQCGNQIAYDQDISAAIEWTRRACEARHKPDRATISCVSLRCPPLAPPASGPGQAGGCSD
jgi:tetratricopeptide (TPR) repeat protein